jgi:hypothetical protein
MAQKAKMINATHVPKFQKEPAVIGEGQPLSIARPLTILILGLASHLFLCIPSATAQYVGGNAILLDPGNPYDGKVVDFTPNGKPWKSALGPSLVVSGSFTLPGSPYPIPGTYRRNLRTGSQVVEPDFGDLLYFLDQTLGQASNGRLVNGAGGGASGSGFASAGFLSKDDNSPIHAFRCMATRTG